jgi:enamine deaminase RidA (YjgF/YER057c/UK114 family)
MSCRFEPNVPRIENSVQEDSGHEEERVMEVEAKLEEMGLVLPEPVQTPPGLVLPFSWVRVRGKRAYISGHGALDPDGSLARPFGKVGAEVSEEQGYEAARLTALAMLTSLKRALGDLDRVSAWLRVFGMVNSAPGFTKQPNLINGFSDLILSVYGFEPGDHARSAVGMAELPLGMPVEIEAEVEINSGEDLASG